MHRAKHLLSLLLLSSQLLQAQTLSLQPIAPEYMGDALIVSDIEPSTAPKSRQLKEPINSFAALASVSISGFTIDNTNRNNTAAGYHR